MINTWQAVQFINMVDFRRYIIDITSPSHGQLIVLKPGRQAKAMPIAPFDDRLEQSEITDYLESSGEFMVAFTPDCNVVSLKSSNLSRS
jgi:hypothetical protein